MKVYFSTSLRAKKLYKENFEAIYNIVKDLGYKHTSDFVFKTKPDDFYNRTGEHFVKFYNNLNLQIKKADVCVFEISLHSLGIGYCVNLALDMGKPVILLNVEGKDPAIFKGIKNERLQIYEYSLKDLRTVLKDALEISKGLLDIRFTFFITPKINRFLTWIAKNKKIPRAVYLRSILDKEIKKKDFKG